MVRGSGERQRDVEEEENEKKKQNSSRSQYCVISCFARRRKDSERLPRKWVLVDFLALRNDANTRKFLS